MIKKEEQLKRNLTHLKERARDSMSIFREAVYDVTRGGGLTIIGLSRFETFLKNGLTINTTSGNISENPKLDLDRKHIIRSQCYYYKIEI